MSVLVRNLFHEQVLQNPKYSKIIECLTFVSRLTVPNKITSRQQQPETPNDPYLSNLKASCHQCQWAEHAEQSKNHKPKHKIKEWEVNGNRIEEN
jgi:hypothetical protein